MSPYCPAVGGLVRLAWEKSWEEDFLGAGVGHFLADDLLDLCLHQKSEREPGVNTGSGSADVSGTEQKLVACYFGLGWVFAQSAQEQVGKTSWHAF